METDLNASLVMLVLGTAGAAIELWLVKSDEDDSAMNYLIGMMHPFLGRVGAKIGLVFCGALALTGLFQFVFSL